MSSTSMVTILAIGMKPTTDGRTRNTGKVMNIRDRASFM